MKTRETTDEEPSSRFSTNGNIYARCPNRYGKLNFGGKIMNESALGTVADQLQMSINRS